MAASTFETYGPKPFRYNALIAEREGLQSNPCEAQQRHPDGPTRGVNDCDLLLDLFLCYRFCPCPLQ